jgi:hypothetical protein
MTLVDTPDLDSTSTEHRAAAEIMIDNADVVVFVSSALRYADLVPWEVLRRARSRGAPLIHVLNRVTSGATGALTDYRSRLLQEGADGDVLVVHEHHLAGSSSVPSVAVRSLRRRLIREVKNSQSERAEIVRSVLWATLGLARELIAAAELGSTEAELIEGILTEAFHPDLERISGAGAHRVEAGFDVSPLEGARPRRARRWMRRKAPSRQMIAESRRQASEIVVTAVAIDLRVSIQDGQVVVRDETGLPARVDPATHSTIVKAIQAWWALLEEICGPTIEGRPDIGALLLAGATLGPGPVPGPALAAILPGSADALEDARAALTWALEPVYASVRDSLVSVATTETTPIQDVDQARTVVAEVVARSAFADA